MHLKMSSAKMAAILSRGVWGGGGGELSRVLFGCQPDEPMASLVTTNRIINVYGCCNVTHVFCPSLFVFCWE